jgi:hypothetical protein
VAVVEQEVIAFQANNDPGAAFVESFIRGLLGDPFGKANEIAAAENQLQRDYQAAFQRRRLTFNRVEEVAIAHGARLPTR